MIVKLYDYRASSSTRETWQMCKETPEMDFAEALSRVHDMAAVYWDRDGHDLPQDRDILVATWHAGLPADQVDQRLVGCHGVLVMRREWRAGRFEDSEWFVFCEDLVWRWYDLETQELHDRRPEPTSDPAPASGTAVA